MLTLVLLFAVISTFPECCVAAGYGTYVDPNAPNITEIVDLLGILSEQKTECFEDLAKASTLCQIGANRLKQIVDIGIPSLELHDEQRDDLITDFKNQLKGLLHRADRVVADVDGTENKVTDSADALSDLDAELDAVTTVDNDQNTTIHIIHNDRLECKEDLLNRLNDTITDLDNDLANASANVEIVTTFVDSRTCEYGLTTLCPNETTYISFKTVFDYTPDMLSVGLVGFSAHLESPGGNFLSYENVTNVLGIDKHIVYTNETGFAVELLDVSGGGDVILKHAYINWVACYGLGNTTAVIDW